MLNEMIMVICISEPDISYTRNKKLTIGNKYYANFLLEDLGRHGSSMVGDVYDLNRNKLGNYFAIDFRSVVDHRDDLLKTLDI